MRIVAGRHKGKALATPKSNAIRPTSDRSREAIFNVLEHGIGLELDGARVLDLFAGSGALGLEALSRGAAFALFVDNGTEARGLLRRNTEALGETGKTRVFRRDATSLGMRPSFPAFDLVFCDPPYGKGLGERALRSAIDGGWLNSGAISMIEESTRADIEPLEFFEELDRRVYGDTQILFLKRT
ncbi:MAG: 16S rRNA (guanine(966)-N(2))-methyltransferase RsmD [Pseudomonadota bacterium]